jgi:hypothetical protein
VTRTTVGGAGEEVEMGNERRRARHGILIGVAALLVLAACGGGDEARSEDEAAAATPPTASAPTAEANAEEIATSFVEAYGAFDAVEAITYLAPDATILELIGSVGAHRGVQGTPEELPLLISLLRAEGYRQTLNSCEALGDSASGTMVQCTFDFHLFGSDRLGFGPYGGNSFDLTVLDGEIVRAGASFEVEEFSSEMWEPFEAWVSEAYPDDATAMYEDETHTGVRLSEESVRLWKRHVREYVEEVKLGTA